LIPLQIVVFVAWPPPLEGSTSEWFTLFHENWLLGLLSLDLRATLWSLVVAK
jgi:hypothetical protein